MGYFEVRNNIDAENVCKKIKDTKFPFRIYTEKIQDTRMLISNTYFHGVLVKTFKKFTGYTLFESKAILTIMFATKFELNANDDNDFDTLSDKYNLYEFNDVIYVVEKTSRMGSDRFNEFVDEIVSWFKDQNIKLAKNPHYKDELKF